MQSKLSTIVALCLATSAVFAEGQYKLYKSLDANEDRYIGPAEGAELEVIKKNWESLDINRGGRLDKKEFVRLQVLESESRRVG